MLNKSFTSTYHEGLWRPYDLPFPLDKAKHENRRSCPKTWPWNLLWPSPKEAKTRQNYIKPLSQQKSFIPKTQSTYRPKTRSRSTKRPRFAVRQVSRTQISMFSSKGSWRRAELRLFVDAFFLGRFSGFGCLGYVGVGCLGLLLFLGVFGGNVEGFSLSLLPHQKAFLLVVWRRGNDNITSYTMIF